MKLRTLTLGSTALMLAACGGSSSPFDDTSTGGTGGSGFFALDSGNAPQAAAASYQAASGSAGYSNVGSSIGVSALQPGMTPAAANGKRAQLQPAGFIINVVQNIPFGPEQVPCAVAGSLTIAGDHADPFTLTAGDSFTIDANACDDGLGEVLDGSMDMIVAEFSGDLFLGTYIIGLDAEFTALQVTTADEVVSNSGDTSVRLDTTAAPFVTAEVDGFAMTTTTTTATDSNVDTLSGYSTVQTVDAGQVPTPFTLNSSGTLDSSRLSGNVNFSTPVTFTGFDADFPGSGELLVTATNSSVRLVALDNVNVRLDIDTDGDGTVDDMIDLTWQELTE